LKIMESLDSNLFELEGKKLFLVGGLDYETKKQHRFIIEATNDKGITSTKEIILNVEDIPNSVTRSSFSVQVGDVNNEAAGSKVSYDRYWNAAADRSVGKWKVKKKIVGGNDAHLFEIKTVQLTQGKNNSEGDYLAFINPPDYEDPQDHNKDNIYEVDVVNINTNDGDASVPIPVTQTTIVVPENNPTTIELQSVPAMASDDSDGDGVADIVDNSPFVANPDQSDSDGDGVGDVTDDADHDGVWNPFDICNDTPFDTLVDAKGCAIFYLPANSFNVSTAEKCAGENSLSIDFADLNYKYNISINGELQTSSPISLTKWSLNNLSGGDYNVCITVEGQPREVFERCYSLTITDPEALSVFAKRDNAARSVSYQLDGGKVYTVSHNGMSYQTTRTQVEVKLDKGINHVKITTGIECQGVFEQQYFNSESVFVSPIPFGDQLSVFVGGNDREVLIELFTASGKLIQQQTHTLDANQRTVRLNTSHIIQGSYLIKVSGERTMTSEIIIKN